MIISTAELDLVTICETKVNLSITNKSEEQKTEELVKEMIEGQMYKNIDVDKITSIYLEILKNKHKEEKLRNNLSKIYVGIKRFLIPEIQKKTDFKLIENKTIKINAGKLKNGYEKILEILNNKELMVQQNTAVILQKISNSKTQMIIYDIIYRDIKIENSAIFDFYKLVIESLIKKRKNFEVKVIIKNIKTKERKEIGNLYLDPSERGQLRDKVIRYVAIKEKVIPTKRRVKSSICSTCEKNETCLERIKSNRKKIKGAIKTKKLLEELVRKDI